MTFFEAENIHIMGIGGIGVSAIARLALHLGKNVSGCDVEMTAITKDLETKGVKIAEGHDAEHIRKNVIIESSYYPGSYQSLRSFQDDKRTDLLIYSSAVPETNPERVKARELGITEMSYPEALGELSKQYKTIAVSGTNGKTTTTAMIGLAFEALGWDPTVIVGSNVKKWDGNFRPGNSEWLVTEACEWRAHFLHLQPRLTVITNIEPDHLDYYRGIDHIVETFQKLVDQTAPLLISPLGKGGKEGGKEGGMVVWNADDPQSKRLSIKNCITFSARPSLAEVPPLMVPGEFNRANAAAALAVVRALGGDTQKAAEALKGYRGAWRRFEILGEFRGANIVSDYAHHPTAVRGTIQAAREFYPGRGVVVVFHPHHQNRTKTLFDDFVESFDKADLILINEIFRVPGREQFKDEEISSEQLVSEVRKRGKEVYYSPDLSETEKWLRKNIKPNDTVLIMGAGDIYKVAEKLAANEL